jgi:hypothetical protein
VRAVVGGASNIIAKRSETRKEHHAFFALCKKTKNQKQKV